jgi:hypothetical protein
MLGQKELMKQPVYLKESVTAQAHILGVELEKALLLKMIQRSVEPLLHIDSKLPLEIARVHVSELHLKDKFPDHALLIVRREGAIDREPALLDRL